MESRIRILKVLAKRDADLYNSESVKDCIVNQSWGNGRKELAAEAYDSLAKWLGLRWEKTVYKRVQKLSFVPLEREIDNLIAGCSKHIAAFLQLLKKTGARASETFALKWTDVDFEAKTVRITPSKGGEPRLLRISHKLPELLGMLNSLPKTSERIFGHHKNLKQLRKTYERQRRRITQNLINSFSQDTPLEGNNGIR
ncbi:MAG: tyrosine-type recombinase/integrase [Candidatus Bathyarchaeia archaeon]